MKHQPEIENKEDLEIIQDKIGYVKDSEFYNIQDYPFFRFFVFEICLHFFKEIQRSKTTWIIEK